MKVLWFGTYDPEYSRNKILLSGLRANQVDVVECNITEEGLLRYWNLIKKLRSYKNNYDVVYAAFPAGYIVPIAWLFQKQNIVVDAFFPMYDAYVHDRKRVSKWSPYAWWLALIDRLTITLAAHVIVDTLQHKKYWQQYAGYEKFTVIPVGADSDIYYPIESAMGDSEKCVVTFQGSYIPLQGVDKIVEAAKILQNKSNILFRFIGPKRLKHALLKMWPEYEKNIMFIPWQTQEQLNVLLNETDIILGIFGDTAKADRVIPNKVFQGIAVKKPVITKDTPAIWELFSEQELYLTSDKPDEIAASIQLLCTASTKRNQLINAAYDKLQTTAINELLGKQLNDVLQVHV